VIVTLHARQWIRVHRRAPPSLHRIRVEPNPRENIGRYVLLHDASLIAEKPFHKALSTCTGEVFFKPFFHMLWHRAPLLSLVRDAISSRRACRSRPTRTRGLGRR
jgi:hypothetical protein